MAGEYNSMNGMKFSAVDRDNDEYSGHCAKGRRKGGMWYRACSPCNINALYKTQGYSGEDAMFWSPWRQLEGLKATKMMVKPT